MALTKISICLLIKRINNYGHIQLATATASSVILATTLLGFVATMFRCGLPTPWRALNPSACPGARPISLYDGVTNVVSDILLCALAVAMVWDVKTHAKNKAVVISLFATRLSYVVASLCISTPQNPTRQERRTLIHPMKRPMVLIPLVPSQDYLSR